MRPGRSRVQGFWRARALGFSFGATCALVLGGCGVGVADRLVTAEGAVDTLVVESPVAQFSDARALASDPRGVLYVADAGTETVVRLSEAGVVLDRLGGPGSQDGRFHDVSDIAPGGGLVLTVADAGNGRLQRFSREFLHLATIPVHGGEAASTQFAGREAPAGEAARGRPTRVVLDAQGRMYALDADAGVVRVWDADFRRRADLGGFEDPGGAFAEPVALAVDGRGGVVVADRVAASRTLLRRYDAFGTAGEVVPVAMPVVSLAFGQDGRLWVGTLGQVLVLEGGQMRGLVVEGLEGALVDVEPARRGVYVLTRTRLYWAGE